MEFFIKKSFPVSYFVRLRSKYSPQQNQIIKANKMMNEKET
jgi:hypothetical protein